MTEIHRACNHTLLQTFEWHTPSSPTHYVHLTNLLPKFAHLGITSVWLPPGCKANNPDGNGYDIYDLWDLGEFDQKRARSTKWGSREELDELVNVAKRCGINVVWDAVMNHKQAGDRTEDGVWAVEVDKADRRYEICPPKQIQGWLQYDFPGREREGMRYSNMKWRAEHFNGTDWDQSRERHAIYKLIDDPSTQPTFQQPKRPTSTSLVPPRSQLSTLRGRFSGQSAKQARPSAPARRPGKGWADDVDSTHGNFDYVLFSNIDYTHPEVRKDVLNWGTWMIEDAGIQGFRLDAVQHFSFNFTREWIQRVNQARRQKDNQQCFIVGEVWSGEVERILRWLDAVQHPDGPQVYAFDSPLLYNFSRISEDVRTKSKNTDLRTILRGSLVERRPEVAVTFVTNHDTQPGQTCATPMNSQLKALFYSLILLRQEGCPCIFWGDLFGTHGPHAEQPACLVPAKNSKDRRRSLLPDLMMCRKLFAYGQQKDYWDSPSCIGWTRAGKGEFQGLAVVMNVSSRSAAKRMQIGKPGEVWVEILGLVKEDVKIDDKGYGTFSCKPLGVSIFVSKNSESLQDFPVAFDLDIYK